MKMISWWRRKLKSCPKYGRPLPLALPLPLPHLPPTKPSTNSKPKMESNSTFPTNSPPSSPSSTLHPHPRLIRLSIQQPPTRSQQGKHTVSKAGMS